MSKNSDRKRTYICALKLEVQNKRCYLCAKKMDRVSLDHVMPTCLGGKDLWCNMMLAHHKCNSKKNGHYPTACELLFLNISNEIVKDKLNLLGALGGYRNSQEYSWHFGQAE